MVQHTAITTISSIYLTALHLAYTKLQLLDVVEIIKYVSYDWLLYLNLKTNATLTSVYSFASFHSNSVLFAEACQRCIKRVVLNEHTTVSPSWCDALFSWHFYSLLFVRNVDRSNYYHNLEQIFASRKHCDEDISDVNEFLCYDMKNL